MRSSVPIVLEAELKFWIVEDALEYKLVVVAWVISAEVAVSEPTFWREKVLPLMFDVQGVWEPPVERQTFPIAKQPPARLMPFIAVVVPAPAKCSPPVVVAFPVMRVSPSVEDALFKFWMVEEPRVMRLVMFAKALASWEERERLVPVALVKKSAVVESAVDEA